MTFDVWHSSWRGLAFLSLKSWEYVLFVIYVLIVLLLLYFSRRDFAKLTWQRLALFAGLLFAPLLADSLFVVRSSLLDVLPPPGVPVIPLAPIAPLLGLLPVAVAAAWLGAGPAMIVGLVCGFLRTGMLNGGVTEIFRFGYLGFAAGFFLRQNYRGKLPLILRQPLVAGVVAALLSLIFFLISVFMRSAAAGLAGLDYAVSLTWAYLLPSLLESVVAFGLLQAAYLVFPYLKPVRGYPRR